MTYSAKEGRDILTFCEEVVLPYLDSIAEESLADRDGAISFVRLATPARILLASVEPVRTRPLAWGEHPRVIDGELLMRRTGCEHRFDLLIRPAQARMYRS